MSRSGKREQSVDNATEAYRLTPNKYPHTSTASLIPKVPFILEFFGFKIHCCSRGYHAVIIGGLCGATRLGPFFGLGDCPDSASITALAMESVSPEVEHAIITWVARFKGCFMKRWSPFQGWPRRCPPSTTFMTDWSCAKC